MDPRVIQDIIGRLDALERRTPRMRVGVVTDDSPLSVALGGADTAYTGVRAIPGCQVADGGRVAVLSTGGDLVVLGGLADTIGVPLVTRLPSNPVDGQEIVYLADATNGVAWRFRYRAGSASSYQWEFVGGGSVGTGQAGDMTNTNNTDTALTRGPTIAAPFSGDYSLRMKITFVISSNSIATATIYVNGVATAAAVASNFGQVTNFTEGRVQGVTAGQVFDVRCSNANSVSTRYVNAALFLVPVRVG